MGLTGDKTTDAKIIEARERLAQSKESQDRASGIMTASSAPVVPPVVPPTTPERSSGSKPPFRTTSRTSQQHLLLIFHNSTQVYLADYASMVNKVL
jgi:hypothetical protein